MYLGRMRYYAQGDRFPYPQGTGGPYDVFVCNPHLANPPFESFPVSQPGAICAAGSTKLNFFRPNQALVRGVVGGRSLGQSSTPILPLAIVGGAALFLFGSNLFVGRRRK